MNPSSVVTVVDRRVIEVQPNVNLSPIVLGPLDRLALNWLSISVVLSYSGTVNLDAFQTALSHVMRQYSTLTGRLAWTSKGDPIIEQGNSSVKFVIARCDGPITCYLGDTSSLEHFSDSGSTLIPELCEGLFALQLTRFEEGFTVGIRISHIVTDADGLTQFCLDFAESYRQTTAGETPTFKTSFLKPLLPSTTSLASAFVPAMYTLDPPQHGPRSTNVSTKVIRLHKEFLASLKDLARPQQGWISTFDALSAHLFQTIHRARISTGVTLSPQDYFTAVNVRSRLDLPDRYFPMATLDPYHTFDSETLYNAPLSEIATTLHHVTASFSAEEAQHTVDWLRLHPASHHRFRFGNGCFMSTKWSSFKLYDIEFGSKPLRVSLPIEKASTVDGLAYMMPTEIDGAIDVYLSLDTTVWEKLGEGDRLRELPVGRSNIT